MSEKLTDMWKSDDLINHQVIDELDPATIKKLSEILNKIR